MLLQRETAKTPVKEQYLEAAPHERGVGQGTPLTPLGGGSLSVLGSTLFFVGNFAVGRPKKATPLPIVNTFPFAPEQWARAVRLLNLPPQQAKVVRLILCGMRDKQIAAELGVGFATVRTYLGRIFQRMGVRDRVELVLRVVAAAQLSASDSLRQDCCQQDC